MSVHVGAPDPNVTLLPSGTIALQRVTVHGITAEVVGPKLLERTLGIMFRAFPEAAAHAITDVRIITTRSPGDRNHWTVTSGDRQYTASPGVAAAARWSEWVLVSEALKRWTTFVHVHAAVVATADKSVLLVGRSGSGKSTTSVALALEGLRLFTDDVALIDPITRRPVAVPRPVKLNQQSRRMLRPKGLIIPRGTWIGESIDRTVIPGLPPIDEPGPPLAAAIFFADTRRSVPELHRITAAEAMMRLILQSSSERFDDTGPSDGAIALVNAVPCYELVAGDLEATVRTVRKLLDGDRGGTTLEC